MGGLEWGLLVCLSVLWGGSFFFVGVAVQDLPPFTIVALRVSLAAAALLLLVRIRGLHMPAHFTGMALIGVGLMLVDGRLPARFLQRWARRPGNEPEL